MTSNKRRVFLKGTLAAGTVGVAVGAGLLAPSQLLAAWPADAFEARGMDNALSAALGTTDLTPGDIEITAPEIAENGAVVPVTMETGMSDVTEMALFAVENGSPLTSKYLLGAGAVPMVATRIKLGQSSDVVAAVKSGGTWYSAAREVKVTIGGCGG
ncbi:Sulfur oxidation protein SoxY [Thioalkalivibrio nitratireducens DSM 14787]|uniref:Sulfur oxidation protein SoxY n=1 Tax=Thioalkalivibrio nitratireducens (strain DSM 14787 / UNIQEM 213 / ALEN2) TaxID=1255043 RepID=L0DS17_THIND|nr:thiosulfate oxidation carrier protein SoxY [Thioalkalivibrio nitratireducens]AGA31790.1 Sulfur oxidation protein SoxY [Thioalkalivibrio nitratireducens DSM 14787]